MDQPDTPTPAGRPDGWTPERKALFLEHLAGRGNVRAACAGIGLSREAAYRLRRREPLFSRAWDTALLLARDSVAETYEDRAFDGIEEDVWYRGERVGTRRRYDPRLMLAHMARLDKLAEQSARLADADRFDEMLACIAGEPIPDAMAPDEDDDLPPTRDRFIEDAQEEALQRVVARWDEADDANGEMDDEPYAAFVAESESEAERAGLEAAALWDEWHARACAVVDALHAPAACAGTVSTVSDVSTSPAESAPRWRRPE